MSEFERVGTVFRSRDDGPVIELQPVAAPNPDSRATMRVPVLLLHGASANSRTFQVPGGGLAAFLASRGFDPWLLDWRASSLMLDHDRTREVLESSPTEFNFTRAAERDVASAIQKIRSETGAPKVSAVGFCMGAAILAEAIAREQFVGAFDRVVLMTMGLFYETPIDGRLKVQDRVIERLAHKSVRSISPNVTCWDNELEEMFQNWPGALKSHPAATGIANMCNRLGFIYGVPYLHANLVNEIHAKKVDGEKTPRLEDLFGGIALHLLVHGAQNVRHRRATVFGTGAEVVTDDALARFRKLEKVTLITGALNRLWHRDSIDLMYEWLSRGSAEERRRVQKHVFPNYAHQDLLWGTNSEREVFPQILEGLTG